MIVEPGVWSSEKRDEDQGAGIGKPIPMGTAAPEVDERPEAAKGGGKVLRPGCVGTEPVAENVGEAGNEVVFDGGRAHQAT